MTFKQDIIIDGLVSSQGEFEHLIIYYYCVQLFLSVLAIVKQSGRDYLLCNTC